MTETLPQTESVAADQLKSLIERIERLEEEIKQLTDDKKDIYAEAKGEGFDVKILREVVRLRKQDKDERDERETLLDVYLHALEAAAPPLAPPPPASSSSAPPGLVRSSPPRTSEPCRLFGLPASATV